MNTLEAIRALNDIASCQEGMLTTAQAGACGVGRHTLSRLEKAGNIERLAKGVYRMGGAPSPREEDVLAVWLSLDPGRRPGSRPDANSPVAMGATAAWLLELGEVGPVPYEFCSRRRRQTQRPNVRLRKREIAAADIVLARGIPATSPGRTVLDLIEAGEDLSLVAGVLNDALTRGLVSDEARLAGDVDALGTEAEPGETVGLYKRMTGRAVP